MPLHKKATAIERCLLILSGWVGVDTSAGARSTVAGSSNMEVSRVMNSSEEQGRPAEPPVDGPGTLASAIFPALPDSLVFWLVLNRRRCWRSCGRVGCCYCGNLGKSALDAGARMELVSDQARQIRAALFLRQSIVAGIDVAQRALDPRLPLRPGFVVYQGAPPAGHKERCVPAPS